MNRKSFPTARRLRTTLLGLAATGLALLPTGPALAQAVFTGWASQNSGTLGAVTITATNTSSRFALDISGSNFCPAGSASESMPQWDPVNGTLGLSFSAPLTNPNLYLVGFRSPSSSGPDDGFTLTGVGGTCTWSIQSGLSLASVSGDTLTISSGFANGVLRCTGTISGINIAAVNQNPAASGTQLFTLGTGEPSCGGSATATPTVGGPTPTPGGPTPTPGAVTNIIGNRTSPSRDKKGCQVQWQLTNQTPELNRFNFPRNEQSCVDGDPACDQNPAAGVCGFEVATCLNNADSRLPECQASGIGSVLVRDPWVRVSMSDAVRQLIGQNRASLQDSFLNLSDPANPEAGYVNRPPLSAAQRGFCSAPFTVNVPVEVATSRKKKRTLTLSTISTSANARGRSTLKLTCRSLPGGGSAPTPTVVVPTPTPTAGSDPCPVESGSQICVLTSAGTQLQKQACEYNVFFGAGGCTTDVSCGGVVPFCNNNPGECRCVDGINNGSGFTPYPALQCAIVSTTGCIPD